MSEDSIPLSATRIIPAQREELRVIASPADGPRRLLTMKVVDGKLVADYDPADLDEAARTFVDAVMKQWAAEMDVNRRFTADTLRQVLGDVAQKPVAGPPTVSVDQAADVVATLWWGCR